MYAGFQLEEYLTWSFVVSFLQGVINVVIKYNINTIVDYGKTFSNVLIRQKKNESMILDVIAILQFILYLLIITNNYYLSTLCFNIFFIKEYISGVVRTLEPYHCIRHLVRQCYQ